MTDVHWINQHGNCDGPHAEIWDGKWRYPKGRTAIRKFIKSSGAVNYELVCTVHGCRFKSSPIPTDAAERLLRKLPVLFGNEANNFPVQPLCRDHHRHWHQQMDGYQWRAHAQ